MKCVMESLDFFEILKDKGAFSVDIHKLFYGTEQDFAEYLRKVYSKLWFDKDIGSSINVNYIQK